MRRVGFTLFELILAIALSATLLAIVGMAVNLYLVRMDTGRTRVEEAQLARSILATIAADIRATTVYQTQDISSVQQLALASADFNVDDISASGPFTGTALGAPGGTTTVGGAAGSSATSTGDAGAGTETGAEGSSGVSGGMTGDGSTTTGLSPGLNGLTNELMLDVVRLPRLDEMYPTVPQQASSFATSAAAASLPKPSDLKSVRYFIRPGTTVAGSDPAATLLSPEEQLKVGGLVRQTVDRALRQTAEQMGNAQVLNSGQVLLAPEVTQIQFIFFDGATAVDRWDMTQVGSMPRAVDVRIWIAPDPLEAADSETPSLPRMYNQTVELPLAQAAASAASGAQQSSQESTEEGTGTEEDEGAANAGGNNFGSSTP